MDQGQNNYHSQYSTTSTDTTQWRTWNTSQETSNNHTYIPHATPLQPLDTTSYQLQGQRQYNTEFERSSTQPHQQQYQQQDHQVYTSPMTPDNPSMYSSPMTPDHPSLYSSPMTPDNPANMFSVSQDLSDAVSRLELQHPTALPTRNSSRRNLRLSMDIQPFISITEPTPVQSSSHRHFLSNTSVPVPPLPQPRQDHQPNNMGTSPELTRVDEFIAQHMAQLEQQQQQQEQQEQEQLQQVKQEQQHQTIDTIDAIPLPSSISNTLHQSASHDDLSFVKQELSTTPQELDLDVGMLTLDHATTGPEWLSWTPNRGNSPVASEFELDMDIDMMMQTDPFSTYVADSGSTAFNNHTSTTHQHRHHHLPHHSHTTDNIDTTRLNTGITTRPRRVSEPPRVSNPLELFDGLDMSYNAATPPSNDHQFITTSNDLMNFTNTASASLSATSSNMMVPETSPRPIRRSHSDRRNSRGSASYPCQYPGCQKTFTRHYNLTSHMRTHTAERPFACTTCQRRFARQHDRNRHEKLHWGIKPFSCGNCQKSFARMDALNRHLRLENGCGSVVNNNKTSSNVNNINANYAMEYVA